MPRKTASGTAPDLHQHSGFSLYDGLGSAKAIVDRAVELGWLAVAVTDHGWLGAAPALYAAARAAKIKPIIGCLPAGQLIETSEGMVPVEEIREGMLIYTHKGRLRRVTRTMSRQHSGVIYGVRALRGSEVVWVTGEHPLLILNNGDVQPSWVRADELSVGRLNTQRGTLNWQSYASSPRVTPDQPLLVLSILAYLDQERYRDEHGVIARVGRVKYEQPLCITKVPTSVDVSNKLARLLGLFTAEGSFHTSSTSAGYGPTTMCWTFCDDERELVEEVVASLSAIFNATSSVYERPEKSIVEVYCFDSTVARWMVAQTRDGAANKRIPPCVFEFRADHAWAYVQALVDGDGARNVASGQTIVKVASRDLAFGLRRLLTRFDFLSSVTKMHEHGFTSYSVSWVEDAAYKRFLADEEALYPPLREVVTREFGGVVYNFEVEEDHSYLCAGIALHNCEMYVTPEDDLVDGDKDVLGERRHLTVLALSFEGYQNLVTWANLSMERPSYYNGPRISVERMVESAQHGLHHNVVLSGCLGGSCCQHLLHGNGNGPELARMNLQTLKGAFPNFYVELMNHEIDRFTNRGYTNYEKMLHDQRVTTGHLLGLAQELEIPVIVTNDSHYRSPEQRKPHMAMMARKQWRRGSDVHEGVTKDSTVDEFTANYSYWAAYQQLMEPIAATLPEWAEKQAIESIQGIVAEADVHIDPLDVFSYSLPVAKSDDPIEEIRRRSKRRLKTMIARHGAVASERFEYELGAMKEFANYLLIYADIVVMARDQGVYTWTRGSACASLVCYCLGVHEIDPIHYQLLFERFVNPARAKFPDVNIDIEAHRRDDVAKMVVEYMHEIGQDVLPICTYSTLSNRNAFRLIAEANGIPKERIDELAKLLPQMIDSGMVSSDEEAYEIIMEEFGTDIHGDAAAIFDTIGGVSQHACAFVIGTKDRPLSNWVPTYRIGSSDALVTQYNMKWIEAMGFLKLDLLRLDTLSILHSVARQLGQGTDWIDDLGRSAPGIYDAPDAGAFQLLNEGRTDGVFTFQGATQRRGCIEVAPETTQDLVAIQALYRPGSTRTGVDKHFVSRRRGDEEWEDLNELTAKRWHETYGMPIYQEQIMEMGFDMGMSGEEVDDLYKAIKLAKGVGRGAAEAFANFEPTFRKYADGLMPRDEADEIWARWDAMQGYSFNRAHATSFAVLGKKSAVCMAEHPLETFIAILERYPDNPRYVAAALQAGFRFESPDVNVSTHQFSRGSDDKSIRVGFLRIEGIGPGAAGELVRNQPFASVEDLRERCNSTRVKQPTIEALRAIGALGSLGIDGDDDDLTQLRLLKMVLNKPAVFKGIKPSLPRRQRGQWEYLGLERGLDLTFGKRFCSKLFWITSEAKLELKAASSGHYSAWLLKAVDENGVPFDLMAGENKDAESKLLKLLAKMEGAVVCLDGQVGLPFLRGGDTTFRVWGVTGDDNPQAWNITEDDATKIKKLAAYKRELRRN